MGGDRFLAAAGLTRLGRVFRSTLRHPWTVAWVSFGRGVKTLVQKWSRVRVLDGGNRFLDKYRLSLAYRNHRPNHNSRPTLTSQELPLSRGQEVRTVPIKARSKYVKVFQQPNVAMLQALFQQPRLSIVKVSFNNRGSSIVKVFQQPARL